jgi:hypothetical protein
MVEKRSSMQRPCLTALRDLTNSVHRHYSGRFDIAPALREENRTTRDEIHLLT